ncbi:MAG TPA: FTR1 family protein [Verrucomicrobiae bacterium]|nr:FTR1 family protein [Verrucomicrobiae bacterium]
MSEPSALPDKPATKRTRLEFRILLILAALIVVAVLVWQGITSGGNPDPAAPNTSPTAALLNIAVLVFREGLECILVLSAITASMTGNKQSHRRPVMAGAGIGFIATIITWFIAAGIISNLTGSVSALNLQAATGLLAVIVLLVIMNWFFHKIYWGGWMTMHNRRKKDLIESATDPKISKASLLWGLGLLGFTSLYREGFEVVLFLQSYYLRMGGMAVLLGALLGLFFTGIVAVLTFVAHRKLPYRKMLVLTGIMLGGVLLVMVGEQAQEMQLAHWISTTPVARLEKIIPGWMGLWFSIFPTVETLTAQALAAIIVVGSYFLARGKTAPPCQDETVVILGHAADCPMAATNAGSPKLNQCPQCGMKLVKRP